jgi:hypothetical protein
MKDFCNENYKNWKLKKTLEMERPPISINSEDLYCENGYTTKSKVQIKAIPKKILMSLFT